MSVNTSQATARLTKEFKEFINYPIQGYKIELTEENNLFDWTIFIEGPPETMYEKGIFRCQMTFPPDYPNSPPTMKFHSDFWHPNVYPDGKVCISILHTPDPFNDQESDADCWRPIQTVESILVSVTSMLSDPNFSSPANVDASVELRKNPESFKRRVVKLVEKSQKELPANFEMPKPKPPKKEEPDEEPWIPSDPEDADFDEEEEEEYEYEEEEE